jgi:hypothetical protein
MKINILAPNNPDLPASARRLTFIPAGWRGNLPVYSYSLEKLVETPVEPTEDNPEPDPIITQVTVFSSGSFALTQEQWDNWGNQSTADYIGGLICAALGLTVDKE